jgi:hypothetical protein
MKYFLEDEKLSMQSFLEELTVSKLNDSFPIVEIALKFLYLFHVIMLTEKSSFSVQRVKNYQKT